MTSAPLTFYRPTRQPLRRVQGFSVIELMVVVAILGLLAAVAAPSFNVTIATYRNATLADEMVGVITLAKVEALRRGGGVVLQKTDSAYSGSINSCGTDQQWSCGLILYADTNRNGALDANEPILRELDVPSNVNLRNLSAGSTASIVFNRWGQANGINALNFRITRTSLSDADRAVCVTSGGRIRIVKGIVC